MSSSCSSIGVVMIPFPAVRIGSIFLIRYMRTMATPEFVMPLGTSTSLSHQFGKGATSHAMLY